MSKKLVKVGNSLALIIDKPILDLLRFTAETELEFRPYGFALLIRKAGSYESPAEKRIRKQLEAEAAEQNDPMSVFEMLDDREKTPSEKLVLVDGKWVVPGKG